MTALFELAAEYRAISDKLHDLDMDEQTIADTLESISGDLQEKSVNVAKYFRNMEADADKIEEAAKAMMDRAKAIRKRSASLKKYLHDNMERAGITKIESPWFVVSIKTNPSSVKIDDQSLIPDDYMREIPAKFEPDKKMIKSAMDEGYIVPGCHIERGTRLEIK
jgi:predicted nuclease with TOPRIM domain